MAKIKFTQKALAAVVAKPHAKRVDYFDSATPGLSLTKGPKSATWFYFTRVDGKLVRIKLGEWTAVGIAEVRKRAGEVEAQIAAGKHPKAEQARKRAAQRESRAIDHQRIVSSVAAAWEAAHLPTVAKTTAADYKRVLAEFVAEFGDDDICTLRRGQLIRHLDKVKARSTTAANRCAVVVRLLFAFARDRFDLEQNPASDIKNPAKQSKRSRTLDRSEIRILWKACEMAGYPYGHALRFALCTGQRIGEVGAIRRSDIDSTGDYWKQEDNKSDRRIDIYLAKHAKAVLSACPNLGKQSPYFSASADKKGHARALRSDTWNNALKRHVSPGIQLAADKLGLDPIAKNWSPHDLRRTVRTALTGWCGVSPDTAERVLNHALSGLREVYDHADYRPHVAKALESWDRELTAILKGAPPTAPSLSAARRGRKRPTIL
jgi:integrase